VDISVIRERIRFSPEAPVQEVIYDADGKRCLLFCLEPDQSIGFSQSSGTVALFVIEGEGFFIGEGGENGVEKGFMAVCRQDDTHKHSLKAKSRFVVLVVIV
jgi:quercetin dioxygenase-like cupin family protein